MVDEKLDVQAGDTIMIDSDQWEDKGKIYEVINCNTQYTASGMRSSGIRLFLHDKQEQVKFIRVVPENQIVVIK